MEKELKEKALFGFLEITKALASQHALKKKINTFRATNQTSTAPGSTLYPAVSADWGTSFAAYS